MILKKPHLHSGCAVVDPGVQAAVEQLLLGVDLLQEPFGLNDLFGRRQPSLQIHPSPQICRGQEVVQCTRRMNYHRAYVELYM